MPAYVAAMSLSPPKALLCAACVALCSTAAAAQSPVDTVAYIDSIFAGLRGSKGPGCAIGVKWDGQPARIRAYGLASLEYEIPITGETIFNAASMGKQFTAAAILLLADEGRLSLDDDVRKYVPDLPAYDATITLRHLIHHTSGLRDAWELLWLAGGRDDDPTEWEDFLAMVTRQRALNFSPGTQHLYSNTGYALLALVVQRAAGQSLRDYVAARITGPLGMTRSRFRDSRFEVIAASATGYVGIRGARWGIAPYVQDVYGSGNFFTTVGDMLAWYEQLGSYRDGLFLRFAQQRGRLDSGDSIPYSMGLDVGTFRGTRYVAHGGNAMGASAYGMRFVDRGLSVVTLCNGREIDSFTLTRQTAGLFVPPAAVSAPAAPAAPAPIVTLTAPQLERWVGVYYDPVTLATRRIAVRDGRLVWARGAGTPLDAVAENRFRFPPGQPAEVYFPPVRAGNPQEMHLISGGSATVYQKADAFVAPAGGLAGYAGKYRSDELDVTLTIAPTRDGITFSTPGSWSFDAEPVFRDAFALPDAVVFRFTRDVQGDVTGMIVDMARSRGMRFERVRP